MGLLKDFMKASPSFRAWKESVDERTLPIRETVEAFTEITIPAEMLPDFINASNCKNYEITTNRDDVLNCEWVLNPLGISIGNYLGEAIEFELYLSPVKKNICMVTVIAPSNQSTTLTESRLPDFLKGEANANRYRPICLTPTISSVSLIYDAGTTLEIYNSTTNDIQANILFVKKSDFYNLG